MIGPKAHSDARVFKPLVKANLNQSLVPVTNPKPKTLNLARGNIFI